MTDYQDLPRRLRAKDGWWENAGDVPPLGLEAADALEALQNRIKEFEKIRELCIKALCRATGDSRDAIEDAPLTRAIAHATQVEYERQRLGKAEALLREARKWLDDSWATQKK